MDSEEIRRSIKRNAAFTFARSSGPGGQNVNKVNTKVSASIQLDDILGLTAAEMRQLRLRFGHSGKDSKCAANSVGPICCTNNEGNYASGEQGAGGTRDGAPVIISVTVQDERFQAVNRSIAVERLIEKVCVAACIGKKRHPTRPTRSSKEKRLKVKAIRSEIKKGRRRPLP